MSEKETGGPAFPQPYGHMEQAYKLHAAGELTIDELRLSAIRLGGMTLRDHFAGLAMHDRSWIKNNFDGVNTFENDAKRCYEIADAMLEARK